MKICVQSGGPYELYGVDGAYRMIRETGFDAVDANVDNVDRAAYVRGEQALLEAFRPYRDAAVKYGLDNYQAHALFATYTGDPAKDAFLIDALQKSVRMMDYINCRNLIVHPFFLPYDRQLTREQEYELNMERYSQLIPVAKQYGVRICLENMFTGHNGRIYAAVCSDIAEACRYIDDLNTAAGEKLFGFCLDTGHLLLVGKDVKQAMCLLGERIFAFHVHDNNGTEDQHLAPYMGILDWERFVDGLASIPFDDTLSFETFNIFRKIDPEICPDVLRMISHTGRMFVERAEALRAERAAK